jgi:hypothetical protein
LSSSPSSSNVSSLTDSVAVTISPSENSICTSADTSTPIRSAKSVSEAPRGSLTISPSPLRTRTPPMVGACIASNS